MADFYCMVAPKIFLGIQRIPKRIPKSLYRAHVPTIFNVYWVCVLDLFISLPVFVHPPSHAVQ